MDKEREIAKLAEVINDRVETNLGQIHGTKSGFGKSADVTTTVDTNLVAKAIIEAGYGDTKQAVREFAERLKEKIDRIEEHCLEMHNWQGQSAVCEVEENMDKLLAEVIAEGVKI